MIKSVKESKVANAALFLLYKIYFYVIKQLKIYTKVNYFAKIVVEEIR